MQCKQGSTYMYSNKLNTHTQARINHILTHLWLNVHVLVINHIPTHLLFMHKVVVECTSGCLPAAFVADLRQVIDHHNSGGVDNICIEMTCQDTFQVPATNSSHQDTFQVPAANSSSTGHQDDLPVQGSLDTCSVQRPKGKLLGCHSNSIPSIHFVGFLHQVTQEETHQ